jgi:two-component system, cell cycle sensor histidine kinase and response regulator CckA
MNANVAEVMSTAIVVLSTGLQYLAALLALRLVRVSRHRAAWALLAGALLLMAVRRSMTLIGVARGGWGAPPDVVTESVALVISALLVASMLRIAPMLRELSQSADDAAKNQRQLQAILDHTPQAVYVKNLAGQFLLANKYVTNAFGVSLADLTGKTDLDFLPRDRAIAVRLNDAKVVAERCPLGFDEQVPDWDGTLHHYLTWKFPLLDAEGQVYAVGGISTDITDRLRADEERQVLALRLQHAQKLESLGILAGGIAHDFNNLLAVILAGADLARSHPAMPGDARQDLDNVVSASEAAAALCKQLLAYSGRGQLQVTPVNLGELVQQMTRLLEVSLSKKARLECHLESALPLIAADAAQLQQVVMNLITNASDALGDETGSISVSTSLAVLGPAGLPDQLAGEPLGPGNYVCLEVTDTGCGMSEESRSRLLEPFYTTKVAGRGLGLAAVAGIVRGHHAGLHLTSSPGNGSTFRVFFPIPERPLPALAARPASIQEVGPSGKVLVVDDEPLVREVAKRALERAGFEVMLAENGRQAVETFSQHGARIILVLLDLSMPEMDGEQTLVELRRIDPNVQVLLSSGYDQSSTTRSPLGGRVAGFIQKPYTARALIEAARRAIA